MHKYRRQLLSAIAIGLFQVSGLTSAADDSLQITKYDAGYLLQVPVSNLQIMVPDTRLVNLTERMRRSPTDRRYFYLMDDARGLTLSGWFEPAKDFLGLERFWSDEKESWKKRGLWEPENISILKIGNWQAIFYDVTDGLQSGMHVRAELLQAGAWVDLHISILSSKNPSASRQSLKAILESFVVREQAGG